MSVEANTITLLSCPKQSDGVIAQKVLEEMVLYDSQSEVGYSLNESARRIWDLADGTRSIQDICSELAENLEVNSELLHEDVLTAINQLSSMGLLSIEEKSTTE